MLRKQPPPPKGTPTPSSASHLQVPSPSLLMPKKRFSSQYSKPQSTVHPSLDSPATSSSVTNHSDVKPSVNDLLSSLRKANISAGASSAPTVATRTLPPQIRHLLAQPETPAPRPRARDRRRLDANGRRIPPGPAAPRCWSDGSMHAIPAMRGRGEERVYPTDLLHLPGLPDKDESIEDSRSAHRYARLAPLDAASSGTVNGNPRKRRTLQDMCLRTISRHWEFLQEYEKHNLVDIPTGLRMALLSNIAIYGPDDGVGAEGLRTLLVLPDSEEGQEVEFNAGEHNAAFFRLDVSGSMGISISFRHLTGLVRKPISPVDADKMSWDETLSLTQSLSAPLPALTHLSLSHPAMTVSWPGLVAFAKHIPTLTHLSLAFWPVPALMPNAKTSVMQSRFGRDIQYGGTNYYSHSLDNDFREASEVLRRLAARLYGLEYLDLTGCTDWLRAIRWMGDDGSDRGLDWGTQWSKLHTLRIPSGVVLVEGTYYHQIVHFVQAYKEGLATEQMLSWWKHRPESRRKQYVNVIKDEFLQYRDLWKGDGEEEKKKRSALDSLQRKGFAEGVQWNAPIVYDVDEEQSEANRAGRRSVWEQ